MLKSPKSASHGFPFFFTWTFFIYVYDQGQPFETRSSPMLCHGLLGRQFRGMSLDWMMMMMMARMMRRMMRMRRILMRMRMTRMMMILMRMRMMKARPKRRFDCLEIWVHIVFFSPVHLFEVWYDANFLLLFGLKFCGSHLLGTRYCFYSIDSFAFDYLTFPIAS